MTDTYPQGELSLMYYTIGNGGLEGNIGGFETSDFPYSLYWSSLESNDKDAWYVNFSNGNSNYNYKGGPIRIRVIRSF